MEQLSIDDFIEAAIDVLVNEISAVAAAGRVGLLLSGGMDSSVIAYALEAACVPRENVKAFTMYDPRFAAGDERVSARAVASIMGWKLHEISLDDFAAFSSNNTPHTVGAVPSRLTLAAAYQAIDEELHGAPFLTGQGGDTIFRENLDISKIAAMRIGVIDRIRAAASFSRRYRVNLGRVVCNLLSARFANADASSCLRHQWLEASVVESIPLNVLPRPNSKTMRELLYLRQIISANNSAYESREIAPLLSQRFVELASCLKEVDHISDQKRPVERSLLHRLGCRHQLSAGKGFVTASVASSILDSEFDFRKVLDGGRVVQITNGRAEYWRETFDRLAVGDVLATAPIAQALEAEFFMQQCASALCADPPA